jgi:hypothetical protein
MVEVARHGERLLAALAGVPTGLAHLDAFSRNVTRRDEDLVLLDWAFVGTAPLGAELAGLFLLTAIHCDIPADALADFEHAVLEGYRAGLADVGCPLDPDDLRHAYATAVTLRFLQFLIHVHPVLADTPAAVTAVVGRPLSEVLDAWARLAAHLHPITADALRLCA